MNTSEAIASCIAVILGIFLFVATGSLTPSSLSLAPKAVVYANEEYGLSFTYPDTYELSEFTTANSTHHIVLIHTDDILPPDVGEGPTAITMDIYENEKNPRSVLGWMAGSPESNFSLGKKTYTRVFVGSDAGVRYPWSSLYEGETTAFAHGDELYAVSVTYLLPTDSIFSDYQDIVSSIHFSR